MKHLFVINPVAGKTDKSKEIQSRIDILAQEQKLHYECVLTNAPMDAANIVRREALRGEALRVYACGGDGTLNEVVNGAAGYPHVAVTQYPVGSGNDFIRIFGEDASRFMDLRELIDGETAEFDLIDCNGRLCLNICSVGLDARIGTDMQKFKKLPFATGEGAYILSTIYHVIRGIHRPYRIDIDGQRFEGRFTMMVAANGRYYGGGFNPLPEAEPDDGKIEFLLVKALSRLTVASVIADYKTGNYKNHPRIVTHFTGLCMDITSLDGDASVNIDGELIIAQRIKLALSERKINFFFPRSARWKSTASDAYGRADHAE